MRSLIILAALLSIAVAYTTQEYQTAFTDWMREHGKVYTNDEFQARFAAFQSNMDYVALWNSQGSQTVLGLTIMADLTNEEYRRIYLGNRVDQAKLAERLRNAPKEDHVAAPQDTVDWRTKNVLTPVKNQGQCGSCWAFSSTGSIEAAHAMKSGTVVSLSEQQLVDCSSSVGNQGCNGGNVENTFKYVIKNSGVDTETSYGYTAKGGSCHFSSSNVGATISSFGQSTSQSETSLATAIVARPVSVAIDASHNSFQLYKSGIYYEPACSTTALDHAVLAVGYGDGYFLVKNSWGTTWGQAGYIQMTRGKNNNCGIATDGSWPVV